jgi:hypothetical protein
MQVIFYDANHGRAPEADTPDHSSKFARGQAEQLLGLTAPNLLRSDFTGEESANHELRSVMRLEKTSGLSEVAIDGARR